MTPQAGGHLGAPLAWLVQAPPLLAAGPWQDAGQWLQREIQRNPALADQAGTALANHTPRSRIGLQFEDRVAALVEHSEGLQLIARNIPIRDNHRTLGELDMLVRDRDTGKIWHWELAIKFYLGAAGHWYGPNSRDTLARKTQHLFQQQLPRSQTRAAQRTLSKMGLEVEGAALLTRGRLFYHPQHPPPAQPWLHPGHQRGWWLPTRDLPQQWWQVVERPCWPTPSLQDNNVRSIDTSTLIDYVEAHSRPLMVLSDPHPAPGFIVPVTWPNT